MNQTYWHKQEKDRPLFPLLEWSRPQNRQQAGKLLIVGGNLHGFAAPAKAYTESLKAGIGVSRIVLPGAIRKLVGPVVENGEFTASTPSGSLAQAALADLLEWGKWSDGVLLAGDMGRNAETAVLVEKFLQQYQAPAVLTQDTIDYLIATPQVTLRRSETALVLSLPQLQKLAMAAQTDSPITLSMDLLRAVDWLHSFSQQYPPYIITSHQGHILVAAGGEVSTTKLNNDNPLWQLDAAVYAAVWWIQNKAQPFAAMTAAMLHLS